MIRHLPTAAVAVFLVFGWLIALVALLCCTLRHSFSQRERLALGVLISLALAAANVLSGNFANGNPAHSLLPLAIYAIALLNSLIVAPLSMAVTEHFAIELS